MSDPLANTPSSRDRVQVCMRAALRAELGHEASGPKPELEVADLLWVCQMGLQPLLSSQLTTLDASAEAKARIGQRRRLDMTLNLRQAHATWSLQQEFLEAGIQVLAYKGSALSLQTTHSLTGRAPGDVDLLIRREDVAEVHTRLALLGWLPDRQKLPAMGQRGWWATQRITCETTYRGTGPSVDLHWRLDPTQRNCNASFDELWERQRTVSGSGVELITLGLTDSLLLTAVHGTRERWMFGRQIVDATRQLAAWDGCWDDLVRRAEDIGAKRSLGLAIGMARRALGRRPAAPGSRYERLLDRAWSHQAVGGAPGQTGSLRGVLEGQMWRWQTADTLAAATVAFVSPGLRHLLKAVSPSGG